MFRSCTPDLVEDGEQDQRQTAPDKYDCLLAIVSDDGHIVLDVWIAIEKLVSPAPDEHSGKQKTITARVNPTRSAGTPACSITATTRELLISMRKEYWRVHSVLRLIGRIF